MQQESLGRVSIVSVTYNSAHILPTMLASIPYDTQVIIVDNGSDDVDELAPLLEHRNAKLIKNASNLGFGVACNQGAAQADSEFLLFLNPDAVLGESSLPKLVEAAKQYPQASAMNPRILRKDGRLFFRRKSHICLKSEYLPDGFTPSTDCEVPVLTGAALFTRSKTFDSVGGFDPNIFLYFEDDDLSRRLRDKCGPLMLIYDVVVEHCGDASSMPNKNIETIKGWHMGYSRVYTCRKHHQPYAGSRAMCKALLKLINPAVLFSQVKRAYHFAFLRGVFTALRRKV